MLLSVDHIRAGYGPITILHEVSLHQEKGALVSVIGPNGAGKSTLLRVIAGQLPLIQGRILFEETDIRKKSISERIRRGLVFIPQGSNIFPTLTVTENLEIAGILAENKKQVTGAMETVFSLFPFLAEKRHKPGRILSGGERQILALSRILILNPRLALLDEPSLGLSPIMVDTVFDHLAAMNREGVSLLLVEQNARKALSVSHFAYVLELGKNRLEGPGKALLDNSEVQRLYLGG